MPSEKSLKNLEEKRNTKRDDLFWEEKFIEFTQLRLTGMTQGRAIEYLQLPERTFYRRYKIWIKERIEEKRKAGRHPLRKHYLQRELPRETPRRVRRSRG